MAFFVRDSCMRIKPIRDSKKLTTLTEKRENPARF